MQPKAFTFNVRVKALIDTKHLVAILLQIKTKTKPNGRGTVTAYCVATTFVFQKDLAAISGGKQ